MSTEKTQIKKVVLEVEGKEIVLTVEGAKKLKELLNELFGRDIIKEVKVEHHSYHRPYWFDLGSPNWKLHTINCGTSGDCTQASFKNNTLFCKVD